MSLDKDEKIYKRGYLRVVGNDSWDYTIRKSPFYPDSIEATFSLRTSNGTIRLDEMEVVDLTAALTNFTDERRDKVWKI